MHEPFVSKAAVAVFEHHGYEVVVPEQGCCGLPLLNNAEFPAAAKYHQRNLDWLVPYARQGYAIVGTSTSCTLTLKEEAPEMLDMHSPEAHDLTMAVWDMFEWLMELRDSDQLKTDFRPLPMVLPYHAPCQYRAHRIGSPALEIMRLIPELDIREPCPLLRRPAPTSTRRRSTRSRWTSVRSCSTSSRRRVPMSMTSCNSETCRWHIETGTDLPCRHPIEIRRGLWAVRPGQAGFSSTVTQFSNCVWRWQESGKTIWKIVLRELPAAAGRNTIFQIVTGVDKRAA
ncbi:MAG: heterodisulfide reductase-related iron-sulfur binding cluster [Caldilineales bacterium]